MIQPQVELLLSLRYKLEINKEKQGRLIPEEKIVKKCLKEYNFQKNYLKNLKDCKVPRKTTL